MGESMRKLSTLLIILLFVLPACSAWSFPLEVETGSFEQVEKGKDFVVFSHPKGYILVKALDSTKSAQSLFEECTGASSLNAVFATSLTPFNAKELGLGRDYTLGEMRPIIISQNNVCGLIAEVKTPEDTKYREFLVFSHNGKAYYLYYLSESKDNTFYDFVKKIRIKGANTAFGDSIATNATITGHIDLGRDEKGRPFFVVCKKKDQIMKAAWHSQEDEEYLGIEVYINSNSHNITEATVDAEASFEGTVLKTNLHTYFSLNRQEVCQYCFLLPIGKHHSKTEIVRIIDSLQITLRYQEDGIKKELAIKKPSEQET